MVLSRPCSERFSGRLIAEAQPPQGLYSTTDYPSPVIFIVGAPYPVTALSFSRRSDKIYVPNQNGQEVRPSVGQLMGGLYRPLRCQCAPLF